MIKAVFVDRDGVLNRKASSEDDYLTQWSQIEFYPGVVDAVAALNRAGFMVMIVTNQRGIARSRLSVADLHDIHERLIRHFADCGAVISAVYYCPHEGGCLCRKPQPGMLLQAAREHGLDLQACWMVGDRESDIEAGRRAGCKTMWIAGTAEVPSTVPTLIASSLREAATLIIAADLGEHAAGGLSGLEASTSG